MLEVVVRKALRSASLITAFTMYLKAAGLAHEDQKKKNRRKWVPIKSILRRDLQSLIASLSNDWPPLGKIEIDRFNLYIIPVFHFTTNESEIAAPATSICSS
jgi:hypothetical protein